MQAYLSSKEYLRLRFNQLGADDCIYQWPNGAGYFT